MDDVDRAVVSPGFMFSLWDFARRLATSENHEAPIEKPQVKLVLIQGGLSDHVAVPSELPLVA